jgi:hypothetical protein
VLNGTAILNYSFDPDAAQKFMVLQAPFRQPLACQRVWHIEATEYTPDWKRNAGVNTLLNRKEMHPLFSLPPKVQCNLELPTLKAGIRRSISSPNVFWTTIQAASAQSPARS